MKKKKSKTIFLILLAVLCFISIQYFDNQLSNIENIIIAECTGDYAPWQQELVLNYVGRDRNIDTFSIYSYYSGSLKASRQSYNNVLICMVDGAYNNFDKIKMVNGRFIWQRDIDDERKYIVIRKDMASELFSTTDCIGREVELNKQMFTVIGVYEKRNWFTATVSSVSNDTVFIPYGQNLQGRQVFLFRVKNNISTVLIGSIKKNLEKMLNTGVNIENIDIKARQARQKIRFVYFFILVITIIYLLKWIIPIWKRIYGQFKDEMYNYYFLQMLKKNWLKLSVFLFVTAGFIVVFYFAIKGVKPMLLVDPELIPSRFIDIEEISKKINNYFVKINTEHFIISPFHAFVNHVNNFTTYLNGILILCWWRVLYNLSEQNYKRRYQVGVEEAYDRRA